MKKPLTIEQRADFVCENQGKIIYEDDTCIIAHEVYEKVVNGEVVENPEYTAEQKSKENAIIKQDILKQLDQLDAKSIRALREGNTERIAQYEAQAQDLREQLNATM